MEKLIIIGSGPAGLTAAIYASRGNLNPLLIAGREAGGQLMLTTDVDDFPGFSEVIQGPDLMRRMRKQAERFGARFLDEDVVSVDLKTRPFVVQSESRQLQTDSLIIATGASAMWLGLESEKRLVGHGVSSCAVCDGFFFKDKNVIVIGGGDTAMREAAYLSKLCKKVTVVHRRDQLRAQVALQELVKSKPNVDFIWNTVVEEILGQDPSSSSGQDKQSLSQGDKVTGVKLKDTQTGKISMVAIDGVFVAIGHKPNTEFLKGQIELDEKGYIVVTNETYTKIEGVFVAGDVADYHYRQAVTAAGMGCKAAFDAQDYLENLYHQTV